MVVKLQEEIEQKTFNIMISTTKLSAQTVLRAVKAAFRLYQSKASQGKQSVRTLLRQNRGVSSVEISKTGIRGLERYGSNYNRLKPIHDELKTLKNGWGKKREKFEQAHESDLIIWNAANRFLHANLPEGTKSFKVSEWQKEFDELKAQSTGEYEELKTKRSEVKELQQIRKCIDIVEQAEQRTQEQTHQTPRRKKEDISL